MATIKQKEAFKKIVENRGNVSKTMLEVGYDETTAKNPKNLTESKGWKELIEERLSDETLTEIHEGLLKSTRLDHMVFPLGPKTDKEKKTLEAMPEKLSTILDAELELQRTELSDDDIKALLKGVNCTVRRIVHGQTARHVYFWSSDNKARKEALDMAYKLKGAYAPEKSIHLNLEAQMDDEELLALANKLNGIARISNPGESVSSDGADTNAVDAEVQNQDQ